jgi:hypothetical protein
MNYSPNEKTYYSTVNKIRSNLLVEANNDLMRTFKKSDMKFNSQNPVDIHKQNENLLIELGENSYSNSHIYQMPKKNIIEKSNYKFRIRKKLSKRALINLIEHNKNHINTVEEYTKNKTSLERINQAYEYLKNLFYKLKYSRRNLKLDTKNIFSACNYINFRKTDLAALKNFRNLITNNNEIALRKSEKVRNNKCIISYVENYYLKNNVNSSSKIIYNNPLQKLDNFTKFVNRRNMLKLYFQNTEEEGIKNSLEMKTSGDYKISDVITKRSTSIDNFDSNSFYASSSVYSDENIESQEEEENILKENTADFKINLIQINQI